MFLWVMMTVWIVFSQKIDQHTQIERQLIDFVESNESVSYLDVFAHLQWYKERVFHIYAEDMDKPLRLWVLINSMQQEILAPLILESWEMLRDSDSDVTYSCMRDADAQEKSRYADITQQTADLAQKYFPEQPHRDLKTEEYCLWSDENTLVLWWQFHVGTYIIQEKKLTKTFIASPMTLDYEPFMLSQFEGGMVIIETTYADMWKGKEYTVEYDIMSWYMKLTNQSRLDRTDSVDDSPKKTPIPDEYYFPLQ